MLVSPVFDFVSIEERGYNWTVTLSTFVFILTLIPFLTVGIFSLNSHHEKMFFQWMVGFFIYAFLFTLYAATDLFYPLFGVASALGSTLIGILFYVLARDDRIKPKVIIYSLAAASFSVIMPLLLIAVDTERFTRLAQGVSASSVLYGYENPRALGWICTTCLALFAAFLSTQPKGSRVQPLFIVLTTISATMLFWSGSRGGVVALTVGIFIVFSFSQTKNYQGLLSVLASICAGGALSYFLYLPSPTYGIFGRIRQNLEQETMNDLSSGRTELWQRTISYIFEHPLTGYGYLPGKNLVGFGHGSAHNIVLDFWLWFGLIIGTILTFFGILLWVRAFAFFRKANDNYISALFCVITTLMAYSMISGPYARTFPLLIFAIASGVILGRRSAQKT